MIGSPKAAYICVAASIAATTLSAAFWNSLIVTGGYFWVTNTKSVRFFSVQFGCLLQYVRFRTRLLLRGGLCYK